MSVNFPLLPPPAKPEATREKSDTDSAWEEAKREIHGRSDAWSQFGDTFKFSPSPGPEQEYEEGKVEDLKEGLLETLKNATNIRNLKSDETIAVCVFGGASAGPRKAKATTAKLKKVGPDGPDEPVEVAVADSDSAVSRGTILTLRVRKSDVDAFAKGKLNHDEFRKKAGITTYAGDTGGWGSGASSFGLAR